VRESFFGVIKAVEESLIELQCESGCANCSNKHYPSISGKSSLA
jgi:hypothetical protein